MRNVLVFFSLLALVFVFIGCANNTKVKQNLITDKNEFWEIHTKQIHYFFKIGTYSDSGQYVWGGSFTFLKNGSCIHYGGYSVKKRKRSKMSFNDVIIDDQTWKLEGDSALYIQGFKSRIISYKKDTLVLLNPITKDTDWLFKVRDPN